MSAADLVDYRFQSFEDLPLKSELLRGISAYGIQKPSNVHQHGVIPIIRGRDCILLAPPSINRMTTLCIGILQRVDISIKRTQALILVNTNGDAQQFRQIINDLCHGDTDVNADPTTALSPTTILINTIDVVHDMIIHQTVNSEDVTICCFDDGEKAFNCQSSGHTSVTQLSPTLQSIHNWLPKDVQMVVTLSEIIGDVIEMTAQVMTRPMTIAVYDGEAQENV